MEWNLLVFSSLPWAEECLLLSPTYCMTLQQLIFCGVFCVASCVDGDVRLRTGPEDNTDPVFEQYLYIYGELRLGRVEVCLGGHYGTVCDDVWDYQAASIVCSQLSFSPWGTCMVTACQLRPVSNSIIDPFYVPVRIRMEYVLCLYMCDYGLVRNYTYALGINSRSAIQCAWPL